MSNEVSGAHARNTSLFSSHGFVLFYLAEHSGATIRQISDALDLSERRVHSIVRSLEETGYLRVSRIGAHNEYEILLDAHLGHPLLQSVSIGSLISATVHGMPA